MSEKADVPLRTGMVCVLRSALEKAAQDFGVKPSEGADTALEEAVFVAVKKTTVISGKYTKVSRGVIQVLPEQIGPYPDDILALKYLRGEVSAADVVKAGQDPPVAPDPRERTRRLFVRVLVGPGGAYADDREGALTTARAIEAACYNAAVRLSRESEDPPRRQWDSPAFVDIYGDRCGLIACQLDPASSSCQAYGATLGERLRKGSITPEALSVANSKDLCPKATETERMLLEKRAAQKIEEKASNLFQCPTCKVRKCTYNQVQLRGADEPPDYMCVCQNCGSKFKGRT
jgi:DNA-directed RNA polymerase subunit M/transcription elongation factor TFIIS